jgi:RimJ/RimL family protein N-acetyltransferase
MGPVVIEGERVRLVPPDGLAFARITAWINDPEVSHLLIGPAYQRSLASREDFLRPRLSPSFDGIYLVIEAVDSPETSPPRAIGAIELRKTSAEHRTGDVGIVIGERADWGRGYGTEAMRLLCRFAFEQMDLNRITLHVVEFNVRAIRSYERVGFVVEGRLRQDAYLAGHYYDVIAMGLLRSDFEAVERAHGG